MLYDEAEWLHHIYGGLVDLSLRSIRNGAEYSTLTEMYLEELLDDVTRNAWWYPVRLLDDHDLRLIPLEYGSVPFSVPLENVSYRTNLFPDSMVMGKRMHVFILCADSKGNTDILDPRGRLRPRTLQNAARVARRKKCNKVSLRRLYL